MLTPSQAEIDTAVKALLALKADFKSAVGQDWKPEYKPPPAGAAKASGGTIGL